MVPILSWFVWAHVAMPCDLLQVDHPQLTNTKQVLLDFYTINSLDLMTS